MNGAGAGAETLTRPRTELELLSEPAHEPELGEALARVARAGQDLAADQVELVSLELRERVKSELSRLARFGAGAVGLVLGWALLMAAAGAALHGPLGLEWTLVAIGGPHLLIGAALLGSALR